MRAGILKRTIDILRKTTNSGSFGEEISTSWDVIATLRAGVNFKHGDKTTQNFEIFNTKLIEFVIRFTDVVTENMRIEYEGKVYQILSISPNYFDRSLTITTSLINE